MSSRSLKFILLIAFSVTLLRAGSPPEIQKHNALRVCADPNNMPYSNHAREGFENRIAALIAHDLRMQLEYVWWSERPSALTKSLGDSECDAWMGAPSLLSGTLTTNPYYRSTYVFLSRKDRGLRIHSLFDERLENWRIAVHVVGQDYAPPALLLGQRGLSANLVGYSLYGSERDENPPSKIVDAVVRGDVDLAIVWGPFAGYFGNRRRQDLDIAPVSPSAFLAVPFTYDISVAVRAGNEQLKSRIDAVLQKECGAIEAILNDYRVPRVQKPSCNSLPTSSPKQLISATTFGN